jgi:hypothetical protein
MSFLKIWTHLSHFQTLLSKNWSYAQEVLGINNRLLSFDTTWNAYKTTLPTFLRCPGNVFTEPLHKNDRWIYRHNHTQSFDTTHDNTENDASNHSPIAVRIRCRENAFTEPLPSNHKGGIHIQTRRLIGGIYKIQCWDGLRNHDMHTKFHKNCFKHSKVYGKGIYI